MRRVTDPLGRRLSKPNSRRGSLRDNAYNFRVSKSLFSVYQTHHVAGKKDKLVYLVISSYRTDKEETNTTTYDDNDHRPN